MDVTIYYNVCATTSYMVLLLAIWISYYSSATYEWQNRYNDFWLFFVSYNCNWLYMSWRILIKLYLILTHMGGGLRWLLLFFRGGGAKGDTKIVPILHHMFENIKILKGTIANSAQNIHNRYWKFYSWIALKRHIVLYWYAHIVYPEYCPILWRKTS